MNLYRRKDGRWEGRITKDKDQGGKRHFFYFFGKTVTANHTLTLIRH